MSKKMTVEPISRGKRRKKRGSGKKRKAGRKKKIRVSFTIIASILLLLALIIALPHLKEGAPKEKGASIPIGAYSYGIDISHYQDDIRWDSLMVMADGKRNTILSKTYAKELKPVSFVFIKATEGANMKDKHFKEHWEQAGKRDMKRGAYHFFRSSKDGKLQARNFIKCVGNIRYKDLPPVLDIESVHPGCSDELLNRRALAWLQEVERHYGRKPIVYSSASFISSHLKDEITDNYPIWVAHYDVIQPDTEKWMFWQFTDKAVVYGIDGYIDLNVCPVEIFNNPE